MEGLSLIVSEDDCVMKGFVYRITGLDPAGPGFYPVAYEQPLNPEDAEFVDSIHSDVFFVGTKYPNGHVDFYPNYNMVQPTCPPLKIDTFFDFVTCKLFVYIL